ncbi:MAG: acyl-CoA dehydrogenase family protein [Hyphomicrobiaceae bacterium]
MNFDFPEELKILREQASRFLSDKCGPEAPRRVLEGDQSHDAELWREMAEMGWIGVTVPEAYGGSDLGHLAACVLAEEIGMHLAPVPFSSSVYSAIEALLLFGSGEQKNTYLPALASGKSIGTLGAAERPGAFRPELLAARARAGRLTGKKVAVSDGECADIAIVVAPSDNQGPWLHIVKLDQPNVQVNVSQTIDPSRSLARLSFEGAQSEPLEAARSPLDVQRLIDRAAVMMAFEQVGAAQAALNMATAYAKERYAFGRPIGSFQAIKHKLADIYVAVELARSNAYYGAWALSTGSAELPIAASVARISASDAGWQAAKENIQTHGGIGYTWEGDCHLNYRRASLLRLALGGPGEWKRRLTRELKARNTAPTQAA